MRPAITPLAAEVLGAEFPIVGQHRHNRSVTTNGPTLGPSCRRDGDASRPDKNPGYHRTEDESTDVGEERDTTATRVGGVDEPVVAFEELVEEPAAEEEPRRDAYWEPQHQRAYA